MGKLLLVSILVMTIALPMRAARDPSPIRGLRRVVGGMVLYIIFYALVVVYLVPRMMG